jgi:uncharacterized membrane protein YcaP (DUF421 family)
MNSILSTVLLGILAYVLLLAATRVVGRKALAQMTFFDFTVAITFGSLAARLGMNGEGTALKAGIVLVIFAILAIITDFLQLKFVAFRKLVNSEPTVLVAHGELLRKNMAKVKISMGLLNSLLREKDVFNISDVEYAILENDGHLSILLKSGRLPLTPTDMNMIAPYKGLSAEVIIEGKLMAHNLLLSGKDEQWLKTELAGKGISSYQEVYFAVIDSAGVLYFSTGKQEGFEFPL